MQETTGAVVVRRAYKRYSPTNVVLRGLNLTAPEATIYGLLGPSGCGKTTLLRCIVGRMKLDSGEIFVKAGKRYNIGYMPQELGLYDYMSIMESFHFYGRLYGMSWDEVTIRASELIRFLELPPKNRIVGTLSGGQQRRLSFAVALLHDPELLILDEPTVGIDPVLRKVIWERLLEMAQCQKKTIIITTHYIEEARQAQTIGLMREGALLAEQPPIQLMLSTKCSTLEQAFLELSQKHENLRKAIQFEPTDYPELNKNYKKPLLDSDVLWNTNRFLAQVLKNFTWISRNIPTLLFLLALPVVIGFICQLVLSTKPINQTLAVVSEELSHGLSDCDRPPDYNCTYSGRPLTCRYIDFLKAASLKFITFDNIDVAKEAVRDGKAWGVLHFSENYTNAVIQRYEAGRTVSDDDLENSIVDIWMDMSNMWISTSIRYDLKDGIVNMFRSLFSDCGYSPHHAEVPLQFKDAIYGLNQPSFIHFVAPGIVCTLSFYMTLMFTTGAIMMEKQIGLERSLVAGMTKLEVVAAHSVLQLVIGAVQATLLLVILYVFYNNPMKGSVALIVVLIMMLEFMGLCYGLVVSMLFNSERDATNAGVGTINAMFMLCGIMWPIQGMHKMLRSIVWATPVQPAVEAYRAIAERSWGFTHPTVYSGYISVSVWSVIFIILAFFIARSNKVGL